MRKPFCLILLCLLCCGFVKPSHKSLVSEPLQPDTTCALHRYTEAVKRLAIYGDSTAARVAAQRALSADSTYAPAQYMLARLGADDAAQAVDYARRAYESDTTNITYLETLAEATVRAARYGEAIDLYTQLTRRGKEPDWFRVLALLYESNDQPFSAIATLDSAEVRAGRYPLLVRMRQRLLLSTLQFERAEREARAMIAETPYMPDSYIALADVCAAMGQDSLAQANYMQAVRKAPDDVEAWASLAEYYYKKHNYPGYLNAMGHIFDSPAVPVESKISQFKSFTTNLTFYRDYYAQINALAGKLIIRYPANKDVIDLYTQHLIASGQVEQALVIFKQNLDARHSAPEDYGRIIEIENYLDRPDSVAHYLALALQRFPRNADMHAQQGHVRLLAKRYPEAIAAYKEAIKYAPTDTLRGRMWGYIGDAEHLRGDMKRCYAAFDKALRCYADNSSVLNNYAYFLSVEGRDLERALAMATRATALSQNNPTFLDTQAWVLYRLGRYAEAKKLQQQALSLDRNNSAELAMHYGDILDALGERFMAQTYWRKALERGADAAAIESRLNGSYRPAANDKPKGKKR